MLFILLIEILQVLSWLANWFLCVIYAKMLENEII